MPSCRYNETFCARIDYTGQQKLFILAYHLDQFIQKESFVRAEILYLTASVHHYLHIVLPWHLKNTRGLQPYIWLIVNVSIPHLYSSFLTMQTSLQVLSQSSLNLSIFIYMNLDSVFSSMLFLAPVHTASTFLRLFTLSCPLCGLGSFALFCE